MGLLDLSVHLYIHQKTIFILGYLLALTRQTTQFILTKINLTINLKLTTNFLMGLAHLNNGTHQGLSDKED